jgi:hypothetical protein
MQTQYGFNPPAAFAGMKSDNRDSVVESGVALEAMDFGLGIADVDNAALPKSVRKPRRNLLSLVFSADLVTSNTINGEINGEAIAQVTFTSNHLTTMQAIAAAIEAVLETLEIVGIATVGGANDRTITVAVEDTSLLAANWVVAAGAGQATITPTHGTSDTFRGATLHSHKSVDGNGNAGIQAKQAVNIARRTRMWVMVGANVVKGEDAYVIAATAGREGMFTNVATNNIPTGGKFRTSASGATTPTIVEVEFNLP